eukprot:Nitzschia sp. Nitz4//scaffold44_size153857//124175//125354//NITZ4_002742-RA/size153857-augustus-gene-0.25-mRNA-1//-1//CDS//3329552220//5413//frame0
MDPSANVFSVGVQSFREQGQAFIATIVGEENGWPTSLVCGAEEGSQTYFYLNPYDTSVDPACAGSDWVVILLLGLIIHTVSWLPRWIVYEPLANWRMKGTKHWDAAECHRLSQTATSLLFFTTSASFAIRILLSKDWLFSREGWTGRGPLIDPDYKLYYLLYAARFFSDLVSLFFEDRKLDAFIAAVIHHFVTLGLVLGSAWVGHIRYGGIIMFFFDWADIPLLSAKICKYLSKHPDDTFQFIANRLFETFAVVFFLTRNGYYNYVVFCAWMDLTSDWVNRGCQYLLLLLVVLQTYWLWLIIAAVIRQQKNGGNAEDVREDKKKNE